MGGCVIVFFMQSFHKSYLWNLGLFERLGFYLDYLILKYHLQKRLDAVYVSKFLI